MDVAIREPRPISAHAYNNEWSALWDSVVEAIREARDATGRQGGWVTLAEIRERSIVEPTSSVVRALESRGLVQVGLPRGGGPLYRLDPTRSAARG